MKHEPITEAMYYVLLSLYEPLHGYAVLEKVNQLSKGRIDIGPGTLYGILKRLHEVEHYIYLKESDGRRKVYEITFKGKEALEQEYYRISNLVLDGKVILEKGERGWGKR
ncbi:MULTISPECIES: PadR family transcriptional regulator [Bacillus]|uniref:PadR family transcriptional regulator n=1 Tax=Bacillus TaxID=1386 RepID=UPI001D0D342F|nr:MULTISPECIES: helix-turn-helix transcriptional regulator [Bacillus]